MKTKLINNRHNLIKASIIIMILVVGFGLYNAFDQILQHSSIDYVAAESFAYSDANFQIDDVLLLNNEFVKEKGKYVYKITFVNNENKYDYIIDARDGSIIFKNQSLSDVIFKKENNIIENKININIEDAKEIASNHFQIRNKDKLIYTKAKLDDEKSLIYSIIMNDNEKEYTVEVSADSGKVISSNIKEKDIKTSDYSYQTNNNNNNYEINLNQNNEITIAPPQIQTPISTKEESTNQSKYNDDDDKDDDDNDDKDDDNDDKDDDDEDEDEDDD